MFFQPLSALKKYPGSPAFLYPFRPIQKKAHFSLYPRPPTPILGPPSHLWAEPECTCAPQEFPCSASCIYKEHKSIINQGFNYVCLFTSPIFTVLSSFFSLLSSITWLRLFCLPNDLFRRSHIYFESGRLAFEKRFSFVKNNFGRRVRWTRYFSEMFWPRSHSGVCPVAEEAWVRTTRLDGKLSCLSWNVYMEWIPTSGLG